MIPDQKIHQDNKRLNALIHLIEDPDEAIYHAVYKELIHMDVACLEALEHRLEVTHNPLEMERIEDIITTIKLNASVHEFQSWRSGEQSMIEGLFLIAKLNNPRLMLTDILSEYRKIKQNVWLEINSFQTPLEKINSFVVILYNYYKILGKELYHFKENHFYIDALLRDKRGNAYSIGALALSIAQDLDIPLFPLLLPHQFLLAYFKHLESFMPDVRPAEDNIAFYFDPTHAHVFSQIDINNYLKKIGEQYNKDFFKPMTNDSLLAIILSELAVCLENNGAFDKSSKVHHIITEVFADLMHPEP